MFDVFHFWNEVPLFKFPTQLIMCIYLSVILADPPRKRIDSIQLNGSPRLVGLNIEKFNDIKYFKTGEIFWRKKNKCDVERLRWNLNVIARKNCKYTTSFYFSRLSLGQLSEGSPIASRRALAVQQA